MSTRAGLPPRLLAVLVPVCTAGALTLAWAAISFASTSHSTGTLLGLAALLAASMFAERFPVPVEGADAGGVSLLYVFVVATTVLYGWEAGALLAAIGTFTQLLQHRPVIRVVYNAAVFGGAAALAGLSIAWIDTQKVGELVLGVGIAAFVDYWVNLLLITLVVAVHSRRPFAALVRTNTVGTVIPFALMASAALMLVVLWQRSRVLSAALVGPLLAISLYQRSTHRALRAMRLALTDPLTGLGNHRHFHERLQRELRRGGGGDGSAEPLPHRHRRLQADQRPLRPPGRATACSRRSRRGCARAARRSASAATSSPCCSPEHDEAAALDDGHVDRRADRDMHLEHVEQITVSAGVATFPVQGVGRDELVRLADSALYWAKEHGKNRVRIYRPDVVELAELKRLARGADRAARFARGGRLARAVDARDAYEGSHSERVGDLAARVAARLGLDRKRSSLTRSPAGCTTSASSPSRRRSCGSRGRSPRRSGSCSSATRRSATGCSRASASSRSPTGCCTTTSAGTAPATRTACTARTSRSARGSSSSPTRSTR